MRSVVAAAAAAAAPRLYYTREKEGNSLFSSLTASYPTDLFTILDPQEIVEF